jgi:hypothetical protein
VYQCKGSVSAVWMGGGGSDGGIYLGAVHDGIAHGKGVILYGDGGGAVCYMGEMQNGVREGLGQEVAPNP